MTLRRRRSGQSPRIDLTCCQVALKLQIKRRRVSQMKGLRLRSLDYTTDFRSRREDQEMLAGVAATATGKAEQIDIRVKMQRRGLPKRFQQRSHRSMQDSQHRLHL